MRLRKHINSTINREDSASFAVDSVYWSISALLLAMTLFANQAQAQTSRAILDQVSIEPKIGETLPLDLMFRDHMGNATTLRESINDKPAVLCLVYLECPMLCKLAADGLVRSLVEIQETAGQDFEVILVSFDPRDTPEQAALSRKQLVRKYFRSGSEEGWHCLTGNEKEIENLTSRLGYHYVWDEQTKQYAHAAGLFMISPQGVITDCLNGVEFPSDQLTTAIDAARAGRLNQSVNLEKNSTSFLRCYLYDPTTGKFGAAVQWTVRVLGIGTVIAMALGVTHMIRRESNDPNANIDILPDTSSVRQNVS